MYRKIIKLMKSHHIKFEVGLTHEEIIKAEDVYGIQFPKSLKDFLMEGLPVSDGFYNWRNMEEKNIDYIKKMMVAPIEAIHELAEEVYWCDTWGEEPDNVTEIKKIVRERLESAPKLLPIYAHRYMPMILEEQPPIISVHNVDIIYYGESLEDYFQVEFGNKPQNMIRFESIKPISFWSEIM